MSTFGEIMFTLLVVAIVSVLVACATYSCGFRDGQIHALSGQSRYVLTTQPDGETRWAEKESK